MSAHELDRENRLTLLEAMQDLGWPVTGDAARNAHREKACAVVSRETEALAAHLKLRRPMEPDERRALAAEVTISIVNAAPSGFASDEAVRAYIVVSLRNASTPRGSSKVRHVDVEEADEARAVPGGGGRILMPANDDQLNAELERAHATIRNVIVPESCRGLRRDGAEMLKSTVDFLYEVRATPAAFEAEFLRMRAAEPRREGETDQQHAKRLRDRLHQRTHRAITLHLVPWVQGNQARGRISAIEADYLRLAIDDLRPFDRVTTSDP